MSDPRARKVSQAALMSTADETEASFYEAMQQGDLDKMMSAWADDEEIACVHPGGPRVVGTVAVRAAFEAVFVNGPVHVQVHHVRRNRLRDRHQCVPAHGHGLAHGGAPRQRRPAARPA
jgi:ketosteroid isomerase-like protein